MIIKASKHDRGVAEGDDARDNCDRFYQRPNSLDRSYLWGNIGGADSPEGG